MGWWQASQRLAAQSLGMRTSRNLCTKSAGSPKKSESTSSSAFSKFWEWTTQQRPSWRQDKFEAAVAIVVFGITGSTSVAVVRPALKHTIGLEGSMRDGPNSYRLLSIVLVSPIYGMLLMSFGTLAGRHTFFAGMAKKIISRFVPGAVSRQLSSFCPRPKV